MTPTAATSKVIKIKVTSGVKGQPIVVRKRNTSETLNLTLGATAQATADLQNLTSGVTSGDVIDFMVSGERVGTASLTISGNNPGTVTLNTTAITSGLSRGI